MGRILIGIGVLLILAGLVVEGAQRFLPLGRLPGDIVIDRPGFRFYFPLGTSILISVVLSGILWLIGLWRR